MRNLTTLALSVLSVVTAGSLAFSVVHQEPGTESTGRSTSTQPTTKPISTLLTGTFRGTVMDDDEVVPCMTIFSVYRGSFEGEYVVREGGAAYRGTLSEFEIVDADKFICRFRWNDKHGTGLLTIQVAPDGGRFAGTWGLEVVQDKLVWTGQRIKPTGKFDRLPQREKVE